jgi:choline kinase
MTAVILAAGISSRLRPLTDNIPKSLLPLAGKPLLQRCLEALRHNGIKRCVIVTGYHFKMIEEFVCSHHPDMDVTFVFNKDFATTNNNFSLWLAKPHVSGNSMLLLDADILFDVRILSRLLDARRKDALVIRRSEHLGDEEIKVELDSADRVLSIGKQIDPLIAAGESLGIERFSEETVRKLFDVLDKRKGRDEFYEASFQEIIDRGATVYAVDSGGYACMEIDTAEDFAAAEQVARSLQQ